LAYLSRRREEDPAQARTLIAAALPEAPAPTRLRLLTIFGQRTGPEDRALLEAALEDRAANVRVLAGSLLERIPGRQAYEERLARAVAAFTVKDKGLIRRRLSVAFVRPGPQGPLQDQATAALLRGIGVGALAAALGLAPNAFIAALPASEPA